MDFIQISVIHASTCKLIHKMCHYISYHSHMKYHTTLTTIQSVRANSHMRLRAHDQYTSSTFIGGKGGAGPSSLHTMLEGPTEYVNARWM